MSLPDAKQRLDAPALHWEADETPASARFGDVYYSRDGGLAEKSRVFLGGSGLPDAWCGRERFTVCELGFGTGLNFLLTWRLWAQTAAPGAVLHYLAVEGHPLTRRELGRCLAAWPELALQAAALAQVYPEPQAGFHRLHPAPGVVLTLLCGDAARMLQEAQAPIDAWYLDGFAPAKNPAMWSEEIFREMARLSRGPATTVATYTAAGSVRRGLVAAGFSVEVEEGFGRKREMIRARYAGGTHAIAEPWFAQGPAMMAGQAAIIGGGIAGTAVAAALARRGWQTTIVERRGSLAAEASGTPSGVVMPRLTAGPAIDGRIHAGAWRYAVQSWSGRPFYNPCGVLQLATDEAEDRRQALVVEGGLLPDVAVQRLESSAATNVAGCPLPYNALHFPGGGCVDTGALCTALAADAGLIFGRHVSAVRRHGDAWALMDADSVICTADVVIFANGRGPESLGGGLPLTARRGQITRVAGTDASAALRCVLAYGGTLTPAQGGAHHVGATFDCMKDGMQADARDTADDDRNLAALRNVLPELASGFESVGDSWAGVRWTSPDHLPVVGPLPDREAFVRDYAPLRHGQHWVNYPPATYESGRFIMAGFGSHGLVLAPLAAELLACHVTGEPWPLERDLAAALHPARFLIRDLKRPK